MRILDLGRRLETQVRLEAFTEFNRADVNLPGGNRSSGNFDRITAAQNPRILQLALRVWCA